jgi:glutathione-independent formaldehyde dehydrogenase
VLRYQPALASSILRGAVKIADAVGGEVVPFDEVDRAYREFNGGVAKKFILDPMERFPDRVPISRRRANRPLPRERSRGKGRGASGRLRRW